MKTDTRFKLVGVGGTFDILHIGHETLLKKAFDIGERVVIGLTSDETTYKKVKPYKERKKVIKDFLKENTFLERCKIIELKDPLGPAADDRRMDAIVVSEETKFRMDEINNIRRRKGLAPLKVVIIPLVLADDSKPISSSRIKKGNIDRNGKLR